MKFQKTLVKFFKGKLHKVCENGNIESVKKHIDSRSDLNAKNMGGWLSLHSVANSSDKGVEITELLIANGADVNAKDNWGSTPLHSAVWAGHKKLVHLLIARGEDIHTKNDEGVTPLQDAAGED